MRETPFYHTKIDAQPTLRSTFRDSLRRLGWAGLAGSAWSATVGRVFDVRVLLECEIATATSRFEPLPGFAFEGVSIDGDPECAREAARLQHVRLEERRTLRLFVARDAAGGGLAACTWNEAPVDGRARHRGVAVARAHRGRGIAPALLVFQASVLGREGVRVLQLRTGVSNRASRRMLHKAGARLVSVRALIVLAGRRAALLDLAGSLGAAVRRGWERESREVGSGEEPTSLAPAAHHR